MEELVLANSGEDEFEEVFKLLVAKLWDELGGRPSRFRTYRDESETFRTITELTREATAGWPGVLEPGDGLLLTPEHLHVCVEALAKHRLSDSGLVVLDSFFEFLVSRGAKGAKGQFFTPRHVVEFCVRMLRPRESETVLDPACGSGGFLIHALNFVRRECSLSTETAVRRYCAEKVWGFDLDARALRVAKALMVLAGDASANIVRLNSLLKPDMWSCQLPFDPDRGSDTILTIEDVCRSRMRRHKGFDVILTNPPFAGEVRERHVLDAYQAARGKPRVERDVLFLERCVGLLRPGGRMAIVLPHNKLANDTWGYVREWLLRNVRVLAVVGLGRNTFLPHTHQKASILFAQKQEGRDLRQHEQRIFFAISERDGKNSKGQVLTREAAEE
ncbi:MAG: N-6 DNA methylase, partial [Gemmataceae bacterium]|nr:N-6 DNA methylase [Gemmataceae bacterium]